MEVRASRCCPGPLSRANPPRPSLTHEVVFSGRQALAQHGLRQQPAVCEKGRRGAEAGPLGRELVQVTSHIRERLARDLILVTRVLALFRWREPAVSLTADRAEIRVLIPAWLLDGS